MDYALDDGLVAGSQFQSAAEMHGTTQNLAVFLQLADGIDDATWLHHLRQGDYSRWFRESIKDEALAVDAARAEALTGASAHETRVRIKEEIEKRYTGAA